MVSTLPTMQRRHCLTSGRQFVRLYTYTHINTHTRVLAERNTAQARTVSTSTYNLYM